MFQFSTLIFLIARHHPQLLLAQNKIIIEGGLEMMYFLHGNSNLPAKSAFRPLIPAGMRIVIFMFREPQVTLVTGKIKMTVTPSRSEERRVGKECVSP